jgi:dihydroflavonol-4-reductase
MRIFLTGATGFIGSRFVRKIMQTPYQLRCLVRNRAAGCELERAGAEVLVGGIGDRDVLRSGMSGCDAVVNLAALYSFWAPDKVEYQRVNVEGTRKVLESALEAGINKVVHVSTVAVFGKPQESPFHEDTPVGPIQFSEYARTKYQGDLIAWEMHEKEGLPLVVIYPGAVLGPQDPKATGEYIERLLARRMPSTVFDNVMFPWVYVGDVAEALLKAVQKEDNVGAKYIVVGENLTFGDLNRTVARFSGVALPRLSMPGPLAMPTAAFLTLLANITKRPPLWGMALDQIRTMREGAIADGSKAARELRVEYTPIETAVKEAVESFLGKISTSRSMPSDRY